MNGRAKQFQIFLRMTLLLPIFFNGKVFAQLPTITPEEAGFDSSKLAEVTNQADTVYEAGLIPNYVIALAKDGKVFFSASRGNRIIGEVDPVGMDTLFPLASMSKPVVSSAIFKLIEDGELTLQTELREIYPQFNDMLVAENGYLDAQFEEANRAITILDLLTHTSGLEYATSVTGTSGVADLYEELGLINSCLSASENMDLLSQLPLISQPGENWIYSVATDVLGAVIEAVTGEPLGNYVGRAIFDRLGMENSAWRFSNEVLENRYALIYNSPAPGEAPLGATGNTGIDFQLVKTDVGCEILPRSPVGSGGIAFDSGGGGMMGTTTDYLRYVSMIAGRGQLNNVRVLEESSVIAQTTQQADAAQNLNGNPLRLFGAGFGIALDPDNPGEVDFYSWGGAYNTGFFVDPKDGTVGVQMSSCLGCRQALIPSIEQIVDDARINTD
jgi:CubicO group peptidase (beta-lactamase class C family)